MAVKATAISKLKDGGITDFQNEGRKGPEVSDLLIGNVVHKTRRQIKPEGPDGQYVSDAYDDQLLFLHKKLFDSAEQS